MSFQPSLQRRMEFDEDGTVKGTDVTPSACGNVPPETQVDLESRPEKPDVTAQRHATGCMVCGEPLTYLDNEQVVKCSFCGQPLPANAVCTSGHFVCDACHTKDGLVQIVHACLTTAETDMIALMATIRSHEAIPLHGPDHHALVPGVILATYRNLGGEVTDEMILRGVRRGRGVMGGACGFLGVCGSAVGVGIGFGIILNSSPLKAAQRQAVLTVTQRTLERIASYKAARCCQRDCWLALRAAAELSTEYLPVALQAETPLLCQQSDRNAECIADRCPLWPV
jgi:hypothetical protein